MHRRIVGLALAVTVGMAAGCDGGGSATGDGAEPTIAATPSISPETLALPLDAYRPTPQQEATVRQALGLLTQQCMKRFGFEYPISEPAVGGAEGIGRRYFLIDPDAAAKYGYHPAPEQVAGNKAIEDKPTMSAAAQSVVSGKGQSVVNGQTVPEGGCSGEASRRLVEGVGTVPNRQLVGNLSGKTYEQSKQHSRVVAAFDAWSQCMEKAGFHYRTPQDANNDRVFATDKPSPQEIATAVADVRCKQEANVTAIWAAVEIAYQREAIEANKLSLDESKKTLEITLRNAAAVVAAG